MIFGIRISFFFMFSSHMAHMQIYVGHKYNDTIFLIIFIS